MCKCDVKVANVAISLKANLRCTLPDHNFYIAIEMVTICLNTLELVPAK